MTFSRKTYIFCVESIVLVLESVAESIKSTSKLNSIPILNVMKYWCEGMNFLMRVSSDIYNKRAHNCAFGVMGILQRASFARKVIIRMPNSRSASHEEWKIHTLYIYNPISIHSCPKATTNSLHSLLSRCHVLYISTAF